MVLTLDELLKGQRNKLAARNVEVFCKIFHLLKE